MSFQMYTILFIWLLLLWHTDAAVVSNDSLIVQQILNQPCAFASPGCIGCVVAGSTYTCNSCASGYVPVSGQCVATCSTLNIPCAPYQVCSDGDGTLAATCMCPPNYGGQLCQYKTCSHPTSYCLNGGQCSDTAIPLHPGVCVCDNTKYVGSHCENPTCSAYIRPSTGPCHNNNACDDKNGTQPANCPVCTSGGTGSTCNTPAACMNGGTLLYTGLQASCACLSTFAGFNCSVPVWKQLASGVDSYQPIAWYPLLNGVTTDVLQNSYTSVASVLPVNGTSILFSQQLGIVNPSVVAASGVAIVPRLNKPWHLPVNDHVGFTVSVWIQLTQPVSTLGGNQQWLSSANTYYTPNFISVLQIGGGGLQLQVCDTLVNCYMTPVFASGLQPFTVYHMALSMSGFPGNYTAQVSVHAFDAVTGFVLSNLTSSNQIQIPNTVSTPITYGSVQLGGGTAGSVFQAWDWLLYNQPYVSLQQQYKQLSLAPLVCSSHTCAPPLVCTQSLSGATQCITDTCNGQQLVPTDRGTFNCINRCQHNAVYNTVSQQCDCAVGYSGPQCQSRSCANSQSKCLNGGLCVQVSTLVDAVCVCTGTGYYGSNCEIPTAAALHCLNGGVATPGYNGKPAYCTCPASGLYHGSRCEISSCSVIPCSNGGTCNSTSLVQFGSCTCATNQFSGQLCDQATCHNPSIQCQNGGICSQLDPSIAAKCSCRDGYTGPACEFMTCSNPLMRCFNGGTCVEGDDMSIGATCQCPPNTGITGPTCSIQTCSSYANPVIGPCTGNQKCNDQMGTANATCSACQNGFTGAACDVPTCSAFPNGNPCLNGGTCTDNSGTSLWSCQCGTFAGTRCETQTCSSIPGKLLCQNGGTCVDNMGTTNYTCQCAGPWSGKTCTTCNATGSPTNTPMALVTVTPQCTCAGNHYSPLSGVGNVLQSTVDSCDAQCVSGIVLRDTSGHGYYCRCTPGVATGANCDQTYDVCIATQPCYNGGVCTPAAPGINTQYTCKCATGWSGTQCTNWISPCTSGTYYAAPNSKKCINQGTCTPLQPNVDQTFGCICVNGWSGSTCQTWLNPCAASSQVYTNSSLQCVNGGTCYPTGYEMNSGWACNCPTGWTGTYCTEWVDPCNDDTYFTSSNQCYNGGNCLATNRLVDQSFRCQCTTGWAGLQCEQSVPLTSPGQSLQVQIQFNYTFSSTTDVTAIQAYYSQLLIDYISTVTNTTKQQISVNGFSVMDTNTLAVQVQKINRHVHLLASTTHSATVVSITVYSPASTNTGVPPSTVFTRLYSALVTPAAVDNAILPYLGQIVGYQAVSTPGITTPPSPSTPPVVEPGTGGSSSAGDSSLSPVLVGVISASGSVLVVVLVYWKTHLNHKHIGTGTVTNTDVTRTTTNTATQSKTRMSSRFYLSLPRNRFPGYRISKSAVNTVNKGKTTPLNVGKTLQAGTAPKSRGD